MDQPVTDQESYVERRQLFKNVWDTALQPDEKERNVTNKAKVIKTLRQDVEDQRIADKKKKQRLKNLRTACDKILDICDRQDLEDMFNKQMAIAECKQQTSPHKKIKSKKKHRGKKKTKTATSFPERVTRSVSSVSPERHGEASRDLGTMTVRKISLVKPVMPEHTAAEMLHVITVPSKNIPSTRKKISKHIIHNESKTISKPRRQSKLKNNTNSYENSGDIKRRDVVSKRTLLPMHTIIIGI